MGTNFHGPLSIIKPDGSLEEFVDADGVINVVVPVETTDLTATGDTVLGDTDADTLTVTGASSFTGAVDATTIDVVGTGITTGKAIDVSDLAAITTGKALHIDATGETQTDGILVHVDSASTALTSTGRLALVDHTGNATVSGVISEVKSAATDETVVSQVTATAALASGKAFNVSVAAMTTGKAVSIDNADALTTGSAISVTSNSSDATARSLVTVKNDHASAVGAIPITVTQDAPINTNFFKGWVVNSTTFYVGNGTTSPDTVVTGAAGDVAFNCDSGKSYYCTGTTNWTAFA